MKIVLCDDDKSWLRKAEELLEDYAKTHAIRLTLDSYTDKNSMMRDAVEAPDLLFMDIELGADNGIEVVQEINRKWPFCEVIYLSNYIYYAVDVYETEHMYFILKDQFEERLEKVFQKIQKKLQQKQERIQFHVINGGEVLIDASDIVCLERLGRKTVIVLLTSNLTVWEKLDEILEKLPGDDFIRCHNSYIVSLPAVKEYKKDFFEMKNDRIIPISRSYRKIVQEAFMQWVEKELL